MTAPSNLASLSSRYAIGPRTAHERGRETYDATSTSGVPVAIDFHDARESLEALAVARLGHELSGEHVRRVYDYGNFVDGTCFVVRERTTSTLEAALRARGAVQLHQAVAWTLDAAEAIAEAHAMGIAHGDVRAANVHLLRQDDGASIVKVVWTSAGILDATKADMARDVAGLGKLLCFLLTGKVDPREADGAPTFPSDVAHAVAKAISPPESGGFEDVDAFARALAPSAPIGHPSPRNIDFLFARAGMLKVPPPPPRDLPASRPAPSSRDALADDWFGRARTSRISLSGAPNSSWSGAWDMPRRTGNNKGFIVATVGVISLVMGATVIAASTDNLPRWTGAAPPEESSRTSLSSAEVRSAEVRPQPANEPAPGAPAEAHEAPVESTTAQLPDAPSAAAPSPTEVATPKIETRRITTAAPATPRAPSTPAPRMGREPTAPATEPSLPDREAASRPEPPAPAANDGVPATATVTPASLPDAPYVPPAPSPATPPGSLPADSLPPGVVAPSPTEAPAVPVPPPGSDASGTP